LICLARSSFEALLESSHAGAAHFLFAVIQALNARVRRLSSTVVVYHEIGKAIGTSTRLSDLLDVIMRQLGQATEADWGLLLLKPEFTDGLAAAAHMGRGLSPEQHERLMAGEGLGGWLMREDMEALVETAAEDPRCHGAEGGKGFLSGSLVGTALCVEGKRLGVILFGHRDDGHFGPNQLNLCSGVAHQAAQAILNARHREEEESRSKLGRRYVKF
jgi:GAF domain-containing protein